MSSLSETPLNPVSGQEQPKLRCRLLELPQEIQINIYERCLEREFLGLKGSRSRGEICHNPKVYRDRTTTLRLIQNHGLELACRKIYEDVKGLRTCHFRINPAWPPDMPWTILETDNKYQWVRNQIVSLTIRGLGGFDNYPSQPQLTKFVAACPRARHIHLEFIYFRELNARLLPVSEIRNRIQNEYNIEDNVALRQAESIEMRTLSNYLSKKFRLDYELIVEVTTEWSVFVIGDIISMYHVSNCFFSLAAVSFELTR